jgi:hypothetical protein
VYKKLTMELDCAHLSIYLAVVAMELEPWQIERYHDDPSTIREGDGYYSYVVALGMGSEGSATSAYVTEWDVLGDCVRALRRAAEQLLSWANTVGPPEVCDPMCKVDRYIWLQAKARDTRRRVTLTIRDAGHGGRASLDLIRDQALDLASRLERCPRIAREMIELLSGVD